MGSSLLSRIAGAASSRLSHPSSASADSSHPSSASAGSSHPSFGDQGVEAEVLRSVAELLNTRRGSAPSCPDYGIPEISELVHDFPDAIGLMQRAIKHTIATYEPRLRNVQVHHTTSDATQPLRLELEISGQVHLPDGRRSAVRIATSIDASSNVKVTHR